MFARLLLVLLALLPLPAAAADRVALVIGMARYAHIETLDNTVNDATDDARPETFHTCIVIASADPAERLAADVSVWGR
jgi:hypothetical protein